MDSTLTLVSDEEESSTTESRIWREVPITHDLLFRGKDPAGRSGWFLRLTVSGLYPRRVGPFATKRGALEVLEAFVAAVQMQPFTELENSLEPAQVCLLEGVPTLHGRCRERTVTT